MTTPVAHVPTTTQVDLRRVLTYLLLAAGAVALLAAIVLGLQAEDTAPVAEADNVREWTRTELLDHLARINGRDRAGNGPHGGAQRLSRRFGLFIGSVRFFASVIWRIRSSRTSASAPSKSSWSEVATMIGRPAMIASRVVR